jgi:hypothetical protein
LARVGRGVGAIVLYTTVEGLRLRWDEAKVRQPFFFFLLGKLLLIQPLEWRTVGEDSDARNTCVYHDCYSVEMPNFNLQPLARRSASAEFQRDQKERCGGEVTTNHRRLCLGNPDRQYSTVTDVATCGFFYPNLESRLAHEMRRSLELCSSGLSYAFGRG